MKKTAKKSSKKAVKKTAKKPSSSPKKAASKKSSPAPKKTAKKSSPKPKAPKKSSPKKTSKPKGSKAPSHPRPHVPTPAESSAYLAAARADGRIAEAEDKLRASQKRIHDLENKVKNKSKKEKAPMANKSGKGKGKGKKGLPGKSKHQILKEFRKSDEYHRALGTAARRGENEGRLEGRSEERKLLIAQIEGERSRSARVQAALIDYEMGTAAWSIGGGALSALAETKLGPAIGGLLPDDAATGKAVVNVIGMPILTGLVLGGLAWLTGAGFLARMLPGATAILGHNLVRSGFGLASGAGVVSGDDVEV